MNNTTPTPLSKEDHVTLSAIAKRAYKLLGIKDTMGLILNLEYANTAIPMDFARLLAFNDGSFGHDISGILTNFNRKTKEVENLFVPRCAI